MSIKIQVQAEHCQRCGYNWQPRLYREERPIICPRCKSPYWHKKAKPYRKSRKRKA